LDLLDTFSGVKQISKWEVATPDIRSKSRYKVSTSYSDVLASHNQHFSPQKLSPSRRSPTHENLSPASLRAKYSVLPSILPEPKDIGTPGFFDRTGLSLQELLDFFNVDAAISEATSEPLGRLEQHLALQSMLFDQICDPRSLAADAPWNGRLRLLRQVWALRFKTNHALVDLVHGLQRVVAERDSTIEALQEDLSTKATENAAAQELVRAELNAAHAAELAPLKASGQELRKELAKRTAELDEAERRRADGEARAEGVRAELRLALAQISSLKEERNETAMEKRINELADWQVQKKMDAIRQAHMARNTNVGCQTALCGAAMDIEERQRSDQNARMVDALAATQHKLRSVRKLCLNVWEAQRSLVQRAAQAWELSLRRAKAVPLIETLYDAPAQGFRRRAFNPLTLEEVVQWEGPAEVPVDVILFRWLNFQLSTSGLPAVTNFGADLRDCRALATLLERVQPSFKQDSSMEARPDASPPAHRRSTILSLQAEDALIEQRCVHFVNALRALGAPEDAEVRPSDIAACVLDVNARFVASLFLRYPTLAAPPSDSAFLESQIEEYLQDAAELERDYADYKRFVALAADDSQLDAESAVETIELPQMSERAARLVQKIDQIGRLERQLMELTEVRETQWRTTSNRVHQWRAYLNRARLDGRPVELLDEKARLEYFQFTSVGKVRIAELDPGADNVEQLQVDLMQLLKYNYNGISNVYLRYAAGDAGKTGGNTRTMDESEFYAFMVDVGLMSSGFTIQDVNKIFCAANHDGPESAGAALLRLRPVAPPTLLLRHSLSV
jgi:hypothetical protein